MTTSCRNFPLPNGTVLWTRVKTITATVFGRCDAGNLCALSASLPASVPLSPKGSIHCTRLTAYWKTLMPPARPIGSLQINRPLLGSLYLVGYSAARFSVEVLPRKAQRIANPFPAYHVAHHLARSPINPCFLSWPTIPRGNVDLTSPQASSP